MSYQVLARKWRPGSFGQLVGQEHVVAAISNALDTNRLHHAYLFTGTRGVGKTTIARIFSKSLNCEEGMSSTPCGQCGTCQEIEQGNFVDLLEIDAASRTKVEDTRELLDNVQYKPTRGRYKVYLIDEVHMLSKHSFNALLKTLEEPPPHVKFLLATTDPQKLPITILSRCLQFNLKALSREQISAQLEFVLEQEKLTFESPAITQLARSAQGSMRDALSLTDQAIAQGNGVVSTQVVTDMLGLMDRNQVLKLVHLILSGKGQEAMAQLEHISQQAPDYSRLLAEMLSILHQVALTQYVPAACKLETTSARAIYQLAQLLPPEQIQLQYQIVLQGRRDLAYAADGRTGTEMLILRMLSFNPERELASADKIQQLTTAQAEQGTSMDVGLLEQQQHNILQQAANLQVSEPGIAASTPVDPEPVDTPAEVQESLAESTPEMYSPDDDELSGADAPVMAMDTSVVDEGESRYEQAQGAETQELWAEPVPEPVAETSTPASDAQQDTSTLSPLQRTQQLLAMSQGQAASEEPQENPSPVKKSEAEQQEKNTSPVDAVAITRENIGDETPPWLQNNNSELPQGLKDASKAAEEELTSEPQPVVAEVDGSNEFSRESIGAALPPWLQDSAEPQPLPFDTSARYEDDDVSNVPQQSFEVAGESLSRANIGQDVPPWLSEKAESAPMPFDITERADLSELEQAIEVDFDASEENLNADVNCHIPVFTAAGDKVLHCSQLDTWSQMIEQMDISALTKQLALHSGFSQQQNQVTLNLLESKQHLNSPSAQAQLQKSLSKLLEQEIELTISLGQPQNIPAAIQQEIRHVRHAHACQVIENSDIVKHFQTEFGAMVVEDSIKAR